MQTSIPRRRSLHGSGRDNVYSYYFSSLLLNRPCPPSPPSSTHIQTTDPISDYEKPHLCYPPLSNPVAYQLINNKSVLIPSTINTNRNNHPLRKGNLRSIDILARTRGFVYQYNALVDKLPLFESVHFRKMKDKPRPFVDEIVQQDAKTDSTP